MEARPHIALLIETSNTYARDLLSGIRTYMREHQPWSIYLSEQGRGNIVPRWLRDWQGDGIIARVETQEIAAALLATRLPVVDVSFGLEHALFPRIITDGRSTSRMAVEHLKERGFKDFGYCGDARYHWSKIRCHHFLKHVQSSGFKGHVFPQATESALLGIWENDIEALTEWVRSLPKPIGIMACYDIRGQQLLEACRRAGVLVPDEIAVIGVHNDELLCDLCDPPLTSIIPNARRAGYEAAAMLARMLKGEKLPPQEMLLEPVGVVTRQSTDTVAMTDKKISQAVRFIREHIGEKITVEGILRAVPISRTAFERRFKRALGCTPHEHILNTRVNLVKTHLSTSNLPLAAIAERAGFEHADYMSVAFKRVTGATPREYRKRNQAGD